MTDKISKEAALAIEHMKNHELTMLQSDTDQQREGYALIAKAAIELNKVLLKKISQLEHHAVYCETKSQMHDRVVDVRLYAYREMERLESEWNVCCNGERSEKDPRTAPLKPGMYIKDGTINEYTGYNR